MDELDHEYVSNVEELEESGTPGIVQDIRAGLALQLKEAISSETIHQREAVIHQRVMQRLLGLGDCLYLLGNNSKSKVCIYSFLVRAKPSPTSPGNSCRRPSWSPS